MSVRVSQMNYQIVRIDGYKYLVTTNLGIAEAVGQAVKMGQPITKNSVIELSAPLSTNADVMAALDTYRTIYGEPIRTQV